MLLNCFLTGMNWNESTSPIFVMMNRIEKIISEGNFTKNEISKLLQSNGEDRKILLKKAQEVP